MARLTRKLLTALGIEDETKQDEIIAAHTETVDALKAERDTYKESHEKLPSVQKELDELKEAAEKNKDNPYKAQYDSLKQEFDDYKADVEAKRLADKKKSAYSELLRKAGIPDKRIGAILRVSQLDSIELDSDGKLKNAEDLEKNVKDEWKDFIVKEETQGADTPTPPDNSKNNGAGVKSRAALVAAKHNEMMYGVKGD